MATKLYRVKVAKGHSIQGADEGNTVMVTEPIARTLIKSGAAEEMDKLPPLPKFSNAGTKAVREGAVAHKR